MSRKNENAARRGRRNRWREETTYQEQRTDTQKVLHPAPTLEREYQKLGNADYNARHRYVNNRFKDKTYSNQTRFQDVNNQHAFKEKKNELNQSKSCDVHIHENSGNRKNRSSSSSSSLDFDSTDEEEEKRWREEHENAQQKELSVEMKNVEQLRKLVEEQQAAMEDMRAELAREKKITQDIKKSYDDLRVQFHKFRADAIREKSKPCCSCGNPVFFLFPSEAPEGKKSN